MNIGETVKVYHRPLTRECFEGEARVVRIISKEREFEGTIYRAMVNFPEDEDADYVVERTIVEGRVFA